MPARTEVPEEKSLNLGLYIVGMNHTAPAVASIAAMVEPVTATLFGILSLNESLIGLRIFGMGLILITLTVLSVYSSARWTPRNFPTR